MSTNNKTTLMGCLILFVAVGVATADGPWSIPVDAPKPVLTIPVEPIAPVWSIPLLDIPLDTASGVTVAAVHWSIPMGEIAPQVKPDTKPSVPKPPNCACPECVCGPGCECCEANKAMRYQEAYELAKRQGKGVILAVGLSPTKRAEAKQSAAATGKLFAVEDFPPSVAGLQLAAGVYDWGPPASVAVEQASPIACQSCGMQGRQSFATPVYGGCANGQCGLR